MEGPDHGDAIGHALEIDDMLLDGPPPIAGSKSSTILRGEPGLGQGQAGCLDDIGVAQGLRQAQWVTV